MLIPAIGTVPPLISPRATALSEEQRLAGRQAVRQKEAEVEIVRQRRALTQRQLEGIDSRMDDRVCEHGVYCEPLQARLAAVEAELTTCLADRKPTPPELEAERVELLASVSAANENLERDLLPLKKTRDKLQREVTQLGVDIGGSAALLNALADLPLANRDLWLHKFVCQQAESWALRRFQTARQQLTTARAQVDKLAGGETISRMAIGGPRELPNPSFDRHGHELAKQRAARWAAEVEAATAAASLATQELQSAHEALLDE